MTSNKRIILKNPENIKKRKIVGQNNCSAPHKISELFLASERRHAVFKYLLYYKVRFHFGIFLAIATDVVLR